MNKIHIGYPKTATTFLQKHIFTQLKKHEFIGHEKFIQYGFFDLLWKIERAVDYVKIYKNLSDKKFFISFEEITGPSLQGASVMDEIPFRLKKAIKQDVKILITIRRQDTLIRSIYLQYLHLGGTLKLENVINNLNFGQSRIELQSFDFYETYRIYSKLFGSENITVIPYECLIENKKLFKNYLEDFFEEEVLDFELDIDENRSVKGFQVKLLRFINNFLTSWISEKYIIPPSLMDQNKFRLGLQASNFLRIGNSFNNNENFFLKKSFEKFYDSNEQLDQLLDLNLKKYGYYK